MRTQVRPVPLEHRIKGLCFIEISFTDVLADCCLFPFLPLLRVSKSTARANEVKTNRRRVTIAPLLNIFLLV